MKLNSAMAFFFSASGISRSLVSPASAATPMPIKQTSTPSKVTWPGVVAAICAMVSDREWSGRKALKIGRQQRAERRAIAQRHAHAQRHAEVTHRQSERQSAETPHRAKEIRPPERRETLLLEHAQHIVGEQGGEQPRADDPGEESADEPVGFPRPFLHALVGHVETSGGQAAEPVKEDAEEGVHLDDLINGCWLDGFNITSEIQLLGPR